MASQEMQNSILLYFQSNPDKSVQTNAVVSRFGYPKKIVNQCLYGLSRRGVLQKVQDVPPLWRLKDGAGVGGRGATARAARGFARGVNMRQNPPGIPSASFGSMRSNEDPQDVASSILEKLRISPQPLAAVVLARTVECEEERIQNLLDQLSQHDIVTHVGFQPVKWILKNDPGDSIPTLEWKNPRSSPPAKIPHTGNGNDVAQAREKVVTRSFGQSRMVVGAIPTPSAFEPSKTGGIATKSFEPSKPVVTIGREGAPSSSTGFGTGVRLRQNSSRPALPGGAGPRPLPPHMLLQQCGENVPTPANAAPIGGLGNEPPWPRQGKGRGVLDYRSRDEPSQASSTWKPPTCLGPVPVTKNDNIKSSSPDLSSERKQLDSKLFPIPLPKANTGSSSTSKPALAKGSSNIPLSPLDLVQAERRASGVPESKILQNQANLLGALSPRTQNENQRFGPFGEGQRFGSEMRPSHPEPSVSHRKLLENSLGLLAEELKGAKLTVSSETFDALSRNPISVLTEHAQSKKTSVEIKVLGQRGPPNKPKFQMAAVMGERTFPVIIATNKKDGRKEAADAALRLLMAEGSFNKPDPSPAADVSRLSRSGTHFDSMAALSHQAFSLLAGTVPDNLSGRKVLAALIMKRNGADTGSVICLGTGNRCITGPEMSLEGHTVNDSHAEIITRRSFVRFLYKQLINYTPDSEHPLLEQATSGKVRIKAAVSFHLYISTAPCGDGALFSPRDAADSKMSETDNRVDHEPTFSNNLQGILRTKIEGGEGTIPIEAGCHNQTWDGILRGERLRTMSCSDKVCRWNILGLQGALLSNFIEPVYLSTLTLGCLYDHGHLSRAVCCRLERAAEACPLPDGFRLNHPHIGRVTQYEPQRGTDKTKSLSLNWCAGDSTVEIVDGTLGQVMNRSRSDVLSRVAKKNLFAAYHALKSRMKSGLPDGQSYKEAKENATNFQEAKKTMVARFKKGKFGNWVQKPLEEKMFSYQE